MEIDSPGGFPPGITPDNILYRQYPRNRRIAEVLAKAGLVERAGQGMDRMFSACIRESKPLPSFERSDDFIVCLTLESRIQDRRFLKFLEQVSEEGRFDFGVDDLLVLNNVYLDNQQPEHLKSRARKLADAGIIEAAGAGRRAKYILSRRFHRFLGVPGRYTRQKGLDRRTNKALLLKHIVDNPTLGSPMHDLMQVLPGLTRSQIQALLRELREEKSIRLVGKSKGARWYPNQK